MEERTAATQLCCGELRELGLVDFQRVCRITQAGGLGIFLIHHRLGRALASHQEGTGGREVLDKGGELAIRHGGG